MTDTTLLSGHDLSVSYGGVQALRGFNIELGRGEIVGVIGPNGAGKTSFIDGVCGFATMTGRLQLDGVDLLALRAHERVYAGLSRTWQGVALFDSLTVAENLAVASGRRARGRRRQMTEESDPVHEALDRLGIAHLRDLLPNELSHGQRVLVGVARAITAAPKVVLMDEPAAGLDDAEGKDLGTFIKVLAASGVGVLLVDHDMNLVFDVCDRLYVLDFGKLIATGTPAEVSQHPAVVAAYLGTGDSGATTTQAMELTVGEDFVPVSSGHNSAQSGAGQSSTGQSGAGQSSTGQSGADRSASASSGVDQSSAGQSGGDWPTSASPAPTRSASSGEVRQ